MANLAFERDAAKARRTSTLRRASQANEQASGVGDVGIWLRDSIGGTDHDYKKYNESISFIGVRNSLIVSWVPKKQLPKLC